MDCGNAMCLRRALCVCAERQFLSKPLIALVSIRIAHDANDTGTGIKA
ncbi:MAG: hypothetical protein LBH29_00525 [Elusimicrobiota bacterium]|nr:hypothetical protein [Elusimicrobiota bacterium]